MVNSQNHRPGGRGPSGPGNSGPSGPGHGGPGGRGPAGPGRSNTSWQQGPTSRQFNRYSRAGQDIMNDVFRAVELGEFAGLAESISRHVNDALMDGAARRHYQNTQQRYPQAQAYSQSNAAGSSYTNVNQQVQQGAAVYNYFLQKKPDTSKGRFRKAVGVALEVFGILFSLGFMIFFIVLFAAKALAGGIVFLILFLVMVFLTKKAVDYRKEGERYIQLVNRYFQYGGMLNGREYFTIQDLANMVNESPQTTQQNLIDMKKMDMIPQATFDTQYTTVMLTDHARAMYLEAVKSQKVREKSEAEKTKQEEAMGEEYDDNVKAILKDGSEYIRQIREANDRIPDTDVMSDKLYRLENVVRSIFDEVRRHPEKAGELRRMMNIYLPTTTKLLNAYEEFLAKPYQTDQTKQTMQEIQEAFDTICDGFEKLLAKMTEVDAIDISTDIDVLNQMMEQDGLKESDQNMKL